MCGLLWCAIHRQFMCLFGHVESRCGHVLIALFGHMVQFGFGCAVGQKRFALWLPTYCAYRIFRVCVICTSEMPWAFHEWFESLWFI